MKRGGNWLSAAREIGKYPNVYVYIEEDGSVRCEFWPAKGEEGFSFGLDRRLARLTARRILSSLDATR